MSVVGDGDGDGDDRTLPEERHRQTTELLARMVTMLTKLSRQGTIVAVADNAH